MTRITASSLAVRLANLAIELTAGLLLIGLAPALAFYDALWWSLAAVALAALILAIPRALRASQDTTRAPDMPARVRVVCSECRTTVQVGDRRLGLTAYTICDECKGVAELLADPTVPPRLDL